MADAPSARGPQGVAASHHARPSARDAVRRGAAIATAALAGAAMGWTIAAALRVPSDGWPVLAAALAAAAAAGLAAQLLGGVQRVLVAIVLLDASLRVDTHLLYRPAVDELGALSGLNVSLTTIVLAILYGLWLLEALAAPRSAPRPRVRGAIVAGLYVAMLALAMPFAADVTLAGFEVWLLAQMLLLFVYLASHVRLRRDVVFVVAVLLASAALQAVVTVVTAVTQQSVAIAGISTVIDESYRRGAIWRSGGTLGGPNTAAAFFAMLLPVAVAIALTQRRTALTTLAYGAAALGLVAIVVTRSRGGWVALAVSLAIVLIVLVAERSVSLRSLAAIAALMLVAAPFVAPLVAERLGTDDAGALASRGPLNTISWRMIADHPLVGVGPNNFAAVLPRYLEPDVSRAWLYTVHNKYLLVWAEGGIAAFAAFVAFLAVGLVWARRAFVAHDGLMAVVALGFGAALVGQMVHMGFDVFNARPNVQLLWIAIALLSVLAERGARDDRSRLAAS